MRFLLDPLSSPVFCVQRSLSGCNMVLESPAFYSVGRGSGKIESFVLEAHRCGIWRPAKKCGSWNSRRDLGPSRVAVPKESRFNYNPESRISGTKADPCQLAFYHSPWAQGPVADLLSVCTPWPREGVDCTARDPIEAMHGGSLREPKREGCSLCRHPR